MLGILNLKGYKIYDRTLPLAANCFGNWFVGQH